MKKLWLMMILAVALGTTVAWCVNYSRYGHRDARFGLMTLDGSIDAENVMAEVVKLHSKSLAVAEVQGDTTYDFGVLAPNDTGEHSFVLKNVGEEPLTLKLGATTCKCTVGDLDANELEPGAETEIKLSWTVKTKADSFSQSAEVWTNDPKHPAIRFQITGKVVREVAVMPKAWLFGEVAAGEPFEMQGTVYTYYEDQEVVPTDISFTSKDLTELTEFIVEPFEPSEADGIHATARQAFKVTCKVKGGMRQGALETNFMFGFQRKDLDGKLIPPAEDDTDPNDYAVADVAGRIVGPISMITGTKVTEASGSFIYDFGRLDKDDSLTATTLVVLKGSERENTQLSIGEIYPAEAIQAKLGEPKIRGSQVIYPLNLEIIPGDKPLDYLGKSGTDFGWLWIESDNEKVARMRVAIKFAVDPRP